MESALKLIKKKACSLLSSKKGFTLIELLVVIGILAILLAIVLIAINPARQFALANNTQRQNDVNSILNAIDQFAADPTNAGKLPPPLEGASEGTAFKIANTGAASGETGKDFCTDLAPTYIAQLPHDPQNGTFVSCDNYNSGYTATIASSSGGLNTTRVTISADTPQLGAIISVTR